MTSELPGLDLDRFRAYFETACPGEVTGPLTGSLVAGGKSNLTYIVGDGHNEWVVRRPPLGHVLATAHDMTREYRVMTALRDTDVPVPRTYALCEDEDVMRRGQREEIVDLEIHWLRLFKEGLEGWSLEPVDPLRMIMELDVDRAVR